MTKQTKITLAAALIAAFATPALAHDSYQVKRQASYATQAPRFVEGRNAETVGNSGNATVSTTDREAMIRAN